MNTTENSAEISWTSEKVWGAVGLTHHTGITIGEDTWSFTVDQPRKGFWVARGWRNGHLSFYRDGARTLTAAKDTVLAGIGDLKDDWNRQLVQDAAEEEPECWCHWVDTGVGEQRVSEVAGCPQHCPEDDGPPEGWTDPEADLVPLLVFAKTASEVSKATERAAGQMQELTRLFRAAFYRPPCNCPTPTHRMSCGTGAAPKVVQS